MSEEKPGLLQGFKEFVMRGNVIDLAVAVVVGAAFGAVVKAFSDFIIAPVLAALGGADTAGLGFYINSGNEATFVDIGAVIAVIIQFLITMAVVYYVFVVPMNKMRERSARNAEAEPEPEIAADIALLTEIRDLLAERRGTGL
jgi:large conductance mechanosensitive channel